MIVFVVLATSIGVPLFLLISFALYSFIKACRNKRRARANDNNRNGTPHSSQTSVSVREEIDLKLYNLDEIGPNTINNS